jgi:hypothetical protein
VKEILKQYENMNWIKLTEYMSNDRLLWSIGYEERLNLLTSYVNINCPAT